MTAYSSYYRSPNLFFQHLLSFPVLDKTTTTHSNGKVIVAQSSMQGWRVKMEDVSVILLEIPGDSTNTMYFAVFDGHGGSKVAEYAGRNLHKHVTRQSEWMSNLKEAITKGFKECDFSIKYDRTINKEFTGSTAITVFIRDDTLYCGNVGDSRAIAVENGRVVPLSFDHKPSTLSEYKRIIAAGGFVEADRVNGALNLSRAFGDYHYKSNSVSPEFQMVTSVPDVVVKKIDRGWEFIVLACDGIWEVMSNEMVAQFVRNKIYDGVPLETICEALMMKCLSPQCHTVALGCDNMSVIIVQFRWQR